MKKKTLIVGILAAVLTVSLAALAMAGPGMGRGGQSANSVYSQLTPEKQAAVDKIAQKYSPQLEELRTQMMTKQSTLQAMINGGDANESKIGKLTAEISDLREKMQETRQALSDEIAKETGFTMGMRAGAGYGHGGNHGGGHGYAQKTAASHGNNHGGGHGNWHN